MNMKKVCFWMLILALMCSLAVPGFAAGEETGKLSHVTDTVGLLSEQERESLETMAAAFSEAHECGLYILVVEDYQKYNSDTFQFAMDVFEQYDLGWGSQRSGVLLMLSMAERDYELLFHGGLTDTAFTEYGRDQMEERFLSHFRNNDFSGGFREYLLCCHEFLEKAEDGHPVDREKEFTVLFFLPGVIAALITGAALAVPMHSAGEKRDANAYVLPGSMQLHKQSDVFVNRTVTRRAKETSSGSGGGSSHRSGSYSGRSGKF